MKPILVLLLCLVGVTGIWFAIDNRRAHARVAGQGDVVATAFGDIEYRRGGSGPSVLVVHGSGGGSDQGELIAQAVLGEGFDWIAPSRFGYLRSSLPEGATFEDQARAYAVLLDHLGVRRVAVVALSHGGPSALLFAAMYPERVSSLTLISCGVASSQDAAQSAANRKGDALAAIFKHDPLYWAASTFMRRQLLQTMGASPEVVAGLTAGQRELADRLIDSMAPVSLRSAGVGMDNTAAMPNGRVADIRAPTLILHATDDALQLYRNAEYAAANIPGARLVRFDRGGHLLLIVEQASVGAQTRRFILDCLQGAGCSAG